MDRDLGDYYCFRGGFTPTESATISALWDNTQAQPAQVHTHLDPRYRTTDLVWLDPSEENRWITDRLWALACRANAEMWGFALNGPSEHLQLSTYQDGGHYDWHMDCRAGHSATRKVSVTVQLSDPSSYTGGQLEFLTARRPRPAPRDLGCVVLFPSYLLHRVTPVTSGARRSLVCWFTGPPLR